MEEQVKNRYLIGTLGALIGAFFGTIPWILAYVFGDVIYALLSIVIVIGAFYGYKITKAKINKKLPIILSVVSFIAISVTMLVIIPIILMNKSEIPLTWEYFQAVYAESTISTALLKDYIISLLFCFIVIGGIIVNLNKQIKHGVADKDIKIMSQSVENDRFSKEDIETARDVFEKNDALSKKHCITKDLIIEELQREFGTEKGKQIFEYLKIEGVIKKSANKYYFSERAQKSPYYRYGFTSIKVFLIVLAICVVLGVGIVLFQESTKDSTTNELDLNNLESGTVVNSYTIANTDLTLEFDEEMMQFSKDQIAAYIGEAYAEMYDTIITDENMEKMVLVLQNSKEDFEEGYTAKQYLEDALALEENATTGAVEEKEIAGHKFYYSEMEYKVSDDNIYYMKDYVYDSGDNFVCIIFQTLNDEKVGLEDMLVAE